MVNLFARRFVRPLLAWVRAGRLTALQIFAVFVVVLALVTLPAHAVAAGALAAFAITCYCVFRAGNVGRVLGVTALALSFVVWSSLVDAYEIPTTPAGTWTASGVTTGTAPSGNAAETGTYFKTTPSGLKLSVTVDGQFPTTTSGAYFPSAPNTNTTGLTPSAAGTNPGVFTTTPVLPTSTNPINLLVESTPCQTTFPAATTCSGLGTIKVTLTDPVGGAVPVIAPKIHVTRLGGTVGAMELATGLQINAGASTPGIGFAASGSATATLAITGGNEFFGDPNAAGVNLNVNCGATATSSAGCGTVQVTGNPSTIQMNVKSYRTTAAPNAWSSGGDAFFFDMSFDEDFGGAPTTYEGGGTAAGHIVTDLRLGASVSVENATTVNGTATGTGLLTASPNAVTSPAVPGDTNDGVTSFPSLLTSNIGSSYTVTPTFSGASRAGKICGWLDFDRSGTFTAAEGVCNTFASGATSAPLAWTVPTATTAGPTYARVRVTYDTNMSTTSFNGLLSSGEVEDYLVQIKPAVKVVKALLPAADTGTFNLSVNGTNFATAIGNAGTTGFKSVYHTDTPDVTVATNVSTAAITGVVLTETGAGPSVLTDYISTSACTNAAGTAVTVAGTALAPSITIPQSVTGASANGQAQTITCTLTNARKANVTLTKISNGAVGGFTFTGTNGWTSQTITTTTSGVGVVGAKQNLTANSTATTITESIPAGYVLASAACSGLGTGGTATPNLATGAVALDAAATAAGSNIACTFTNTKLPTIVVTKNSVGGVGAFNFTGTNGYPGQTITTVTSGVNAAGPTVTLAAANALTRITEAVPAGYALTNIACVGTGAGNTSNNLASGFVDIAVGGTAPGATINCTFANTKLPTVTLTKVSNGGVGPYTFTGNNGWTSQMITTITAGTGVSGVAQTLTAAAAVTTITEAIPAGYALASATCTGLGSGGTATPNLATGALVFDAAATAAGSNIACTFTNTKLPTVTLTKISNGGVGPFTFTGTNGWSSQTITTTTSGTGLAGATQVLTAASTATRISEAIPAGYVLSNIACSGAGAGNTTNNLASGYVDIVAAGVPAGATLNCTFTNDKLPSLTLVKTVTNDNGGALVANTVNITATGASTITGVTGAASVTNALVPLGTYGLSETNPSGYLAGAWSCSAGTLAGSNLTLTAGQIATCTINNNDIQPKLTLIKTVTNDNGGSAAVSAFTLSAVNGGTTISGASGTASVTNAGVNVGTWALSETGPAGYVQGSWVCTTGTLVGSNLTLAPGDSSTCTVNNNDISPKLTLVKQVVNDNGGTLAANTVTLTASGPTPITGLTGAAAVTSANVNAGTYTLTEAATPGYTQGAWSCTAGTLTGNSLVLALNQTATCTITNNDTAPVLTLVKTITNDNGGTVAANTVSLSAVGPVSIAGTTGSAAVTSAVVNAGTYALSEANPAGYAAGAWSCSAGTLTGSSLVLVLGQTATCTINDNDISPVLTLVKTVTNDNGGSIAASSVNLTATGPTTVTGASGSAAVTNAAVNPGTYTLTEVNPVGYAAGAWSCSAGTLTGNSLVLALGQSASCTISDNDISPILTLVKTVTNDDGGTLAANTVNLTATGPTTISGVTGNAAVTSASVNAGSYVLTETTVSGYAAGAWSCSAGTLSGSNLTLAPGQNATCTINNNDIAPKLTLVKTVTNDDGGAAAATAFSLSATGPATITGSTGSGAVTNASIRVGAYVLSETGPAGYSAGSWSCTAGTLVGSTLTLAAGAVATCTINNNDIAPVLTLIKTITNDNGGTVAANSVSLSAVGPVSIAGVTGSGAVTTATVKAGTYALSEANPAGYAAGAWSCTAGTLSGSNLTLANGQTSTCTINDNDISPVLTLSKTVTNDNGGTVLVSAFPLTATGPTTITGVNGAVAVTAASVNAGVYTLSETGPAGYTAGAWSCSAGTLAGSSLTLAPGQTAVCSINNNDDPAKLTLVKTVTNDNGGSNVVADFTLKATGPTTISGASTAAAVTNATVNSGTYALSETGPAGYLASSWSCSAGTLTGSSLALGSGQNATCTLNNNDIAPRLTLAKTVTNTHGGVATVPDFTLTATGPTTITGLTTAPAVTNAPVNVGTYVLSETGPPGYSAGAWSCSAGSLTGNSLVLGLNQIATCTINNADISPKLTLVKIVTNNSGGSNFATDFTLKATGPSTITGATGSASVTNANVNVGTFALSETGPSGYTAAAWSCVGGSLSGSNLTLALNQSATCTINNDDTPATIVLNKISNGGTGSFNFNGTNGVGAQSITTTTSGTGVATSPITLTASSTATTITETIPTGYGLTAASCAGMGSGTATPNLLTGALALDAAATAPGNAVNCTFTNGVANFTVAKSASAANVSAPGPVTYTITVVNTGLANMSSPAISDTLTLGGSPRTLTSGPMLVSGDNAPTGVLNVGETWTYTATYNVTQADIDAGGTLSNTATFSTQQTTPVASSPATTTLTQTPKLTIDKQVDPTTLSFSAVGNIIKYNFVVLNSGNTTVTSQIAITDPKISPAASCPIPGAGLAPGQSITCTGTSVPMTQADLDFGSFTNNATATDGTITSLPDSVTVPAVQDPKMAVAKSTAGAPPTSSFTAVGDTWYYKYDVTNTGNVTMVAPINVTDNVVTPHTFLCSNLNLSPGSTVSCLASYVVTLDDLSLGSITNLASATSTNGTSPQTSLTIPPAANPALTIVKSSPTLSFNAAGATITYKYRVINSGGATFTSIRSIDVVDDKIGTFTCFTPAPTFLPGAFKDCPDQTYSVTQAQVDAGFVTNQAYAQTTYGGLAPVGNIVVTSPPKSVIVNANQNPVLTVTKSVAPALTGVLGQSLTYTIKVKNDGNVTASDIAVTDPLIPSLSCTIASLAPAASDNTCTGTYIVKQSDIDLGLINNTASATGKAPLGNSVSGSGSLATPVPQIKTMSVVKAQSSNADQDSSGTITLNDTLTYTVTATNTGTVTQTNVQVTDTKITSNNKTCAIVAPGTSCILTGTYTVTQTDVDAGTIGNTGSLTSTIITSPQTSTVNTPVAQSSVLTLAKVKTGYTDNDLTSTLTVGDTVAYTVTATNAGTVTQNSVVVSDPLLTPNSITCPTLAPAATCVLSGTHIVMASEATAGQVVNTGSVTSTLIPTAVTSSVTTPVTRIIIATNDTPAATNGASGAANVVNAYNNDTLNGVTATPANVTGTVLTPATSIGGGPVPTLDVATGIVSVPAGTPAGGYTIQYQICETAVPTNCAVANITVPVSAAPVLATPDTVTGINGATGATGVTNAFNGDTINGNPATPANSTLAANTAVPPQLAFNPATGAVDVLPNTPSGTYTFDYKICEKLNPTNCQIATISVTVVAAPLVANNDTPAATNGANGNPSLIDAYANDTLNGVPVSTGTITGSVVTPATSIGGKPVPLLDPASGIVSVPAGTPAGTYTITYQICEQLNPVANCKTATVTVPVTAAPIVAGNDTPSAINGANGSTIPSVLGNDTFNGLPIVPAAIMLTPGTSPSPSITMNPDGTITVAAGTPAGTYSYPYTICEKLNPSNCSTAIVTIVVDAAPIVATNDNPAPINGGSGGSTPTVLINDSFNGLPIVPAAIALTPGTAPAPTAGAIVMNPDGTITVAAGTTAGTYSYPYTICENLNPANCSSAIGTVIVTAAPIIALNDSTTPINGKTGAANVIDVFANDSLNGSTVVPAKINATVLSPATPLTLGANVPTLVAATGLVSVPADTPAGTYSITYQICEKLNPSNCATAVVIVDVSASAIAANIDTPPSVNGATGQANIVAAYANDTLNGSPVVLTDITGTVTTPATPAFAGAIVPMMDPATGSVSVPPGTPAGTYAIAYKICENLNPTNCSTSTVTVVVDAAPVVAMNDTATGVNGFTGATAVVNAFTGDTINGAPATTTNSIIAFEPTIGIPSVPAGLTFDTSTGNVDVAAGTPAGTYTFSYKLCEKLNPTNCQIAVISVTVNAAVIAANPDAPPSVNGATGNPSLVNAYANDTLNGAPLVANTFTGTVTTPAASLGGPVPALDPATGTVAVPAGTPAGTYVITYKICENLNPLNCASNTVTVVVDPSAVVATNDAASGINGATGATAVANAFTGDTVNGQPATAANAILSFEPTIGVPTLPAGLTFNTTTGNVDVAANTPAGTYVFSYKICEKLNPSNCQIATITVGVVAAPIVATNDNPASINGGSGGSTPTVLANDLFNGLPIVPAAIALTSGTAPTPAAGAITLNADGTITVAARTTAGTYSYPYTICENLNPTNCSTAIATVIVTAAPILANNDFAPITNGLVGNPSVDNAYANDLLNGVAVIASAINGTVLTPATSIGGKPVPVLDPATGNISVPSGTPAGSYTIQYQICDKLNPTNCSSAVITIPVDVAQIVALNDTPAAVNGVNGNANIVNAFTNDTLNGVAVVTTEITATVLTGATPVTLGAPVPLLDVATGIVSVPANTPAGTYTINYQICENLNPTNCAVADVIVVVDPSPIVATNDSATGINGLLGASNVLNVFTGDTINGAAATSGNSILNVAPLSNLPPQLTFDTATGNVSVVAGTPAGVYTFDYQICEKLNPTNCKIATATVTVGAAVITANVDTPASISGLTGGSTPSVLGNDTLNGLSVVPTDINLAPGTAPTPVAGSITMNPDGTVTVAPGTTAGSYPFSYTICEKLNPTNCSTAIATITVGAAPIAAIIDTPTSISGLAGGSTPTVLGNDTLNGIAVVPTDINLTPGTAPTPTTGSITMNPDGTVTIAPNTTAGSYPYSYTICEKLNPTNCSTTTVTILVGAAPIAAVADTPASINGLTGGSTPTVLGNDTLNGVAVVPTDINLAPGTAPTPTAGSITMNPDGTVTIAPGTTAGSYPYSYTICEKLNPTNCSTTTATILVGVAPIVAVLDTPASTSGLTGGSTPSVLGNDTLNGVAVDPAAINLAPGTAPAPTAGSITMNPDGTVTIAPGTTAGSYPYSYTICEKLNPTNCSTATATISVDVAPIAALADTPPAIVGAAGGSTPTVLANDTLNGTPVVLSAINLTPGTAPTPTLGSITMNPDGTITVAPGTTAGSYPYSYQICEKLNPTNCSTAIATVVVDVAVIAAIADTTPSINGATGGSTLSVLANDTLNGAPVVLSAINLTPGTAPTPLAGSITMNPDGTVTIAPSTTAGSYPYSYTICEKANPLNCSTAIATIVVGAAPILATADAPAAVNGATGSPNVGNAFANDTLNGVLLDTSAKVATITATVTTPATSISGGPVPTLDPLTGIVSVPAGTPASPLGTPYVITYQICENLNPTNCNSTTITVPVNPPLIVATGDNLLPAGPATTFDTKVALTNVGNVFTNDTLNGVAVTPATVSLTVIGTLPAGINLNPDGSIDLAQYTASGSYSFQYQICEILNPTNCKIATVTIPIKKTVPAVSGTVFFDTNGNGVKDSSEQVLPGYTVELVLNGVVVDSTLTATDGTYSIFGFPPGSGYQLIFKNPSGVSVGAITGLDFTNSTILTNVNQPIDPSGVIYNSITGLPVAGAVVTMTSGGVALPAVCLLPGQQTQTTTANGQYRFDIVAGADPACPVGPTVYTIAVVSPVNYLPAPSTIYAPRGGSLNADACAVAPAACLVSPTATAPPTGTTQPYYFSFLLQAGSPNVINNHIPLDPILAGTAAFTKTALKTEVHRGERVPYVIQATAMNFPKANVVDIIPPGFDFVPGSALVNGIAATPAINGNQLTFSNITATGGALKIELTLIANAAVQPGPATNKAQLLNFFTNNLVANARATVTVVADPVLDCGEIIGRVFEDANRNGYQDQGEKGLPGVRIATVKGLLVTTDKFGRFHVACADIPDHSIGSNFLMKLDTRTLPTGYRLTTENPRDVRLTAGKMTKLNFGASIAHLVDLDLNGKVFTSGSTELLPQWNAGLGTLIAKLGEEPSTLRLTYHTESEPSALASKRLAAVSALITKLWSRADGSYDLPIETRSVDAKGGAQ